jgi:hypothetical protein
VSVGTPGTRGYRAPGGSFTWTQDGATKTYAVTSCTIANGKASLYGVSADGAAGRAIIEDYPGGTDLVRTSSGMLVTLWQVTSGDFRVSQ